MSRKKIKPIPIEHQILDYFESVDQANGLLLLGFIQRAMTRRFPVESAPEVKIRANSLVGKANGGRKLSKSEVDKTARKIRDKFDSKSRGETIAGLQSGLIIPQDLEIT